MSTVATHRFTSYRTVRRMPRVLRPLLRPLFKAIDRHANPFAVKPGGSFPLAAGSSIAPIRPLRRSEFESLAREHPYYRDRARYFGAAAWAAADLIDRHGLTTALELGPNVRPLISGADVMDRVARPGLEASGTVLLHDATSTPWPIDSNRYDLFVALQVFEHLGGDQPRVFREVRRIARHAVISLPIDWEMEDPHNPHHGISHEAVLSWFAPTDPTRVIVGNPGYRQRLIYTFENLS